jgi:putative copper resistance protein D
VLAQLLDLFGFLAVLCRGLTLALASLTVGGVGFSLITLRSGAGIYAEECIPALSAVKRWTVRAAIALAAVQLFWLAVNSAVLMETTGLRPGDVYGANFFLSGALMLASACAIALGVCRAARPRLWLLAPGAAIIAAEVMTSHSVARVAARGWLIMLTALHQGAVAVWIGGLFFWVLAVRSAIDFPFVQRVSKRFSASAQLGAGVLFLAGMGLMVFYVRSAGALVGTNYGVMVLAKIALFALVLLLGRLNHLVVWRSKLETMAMLVRLKALGEAEIGIGFTVILAAASLTSQPPAVDLPNDRVGVETILERMSPRFPRLATPPLSSLSPSSRQLWKQQNREQTASQPYIPGSEPYTPPTAGDIAWSEYNHHWAGLVVLCAGVLALLSRSRYARWARHWPLAFCGLAFFLFVRADPENWPLGPNGFLESFTSADVLQHRLFVLLILGFSAFEWGIQTGHLRQKSAAMVFPLVCVSGGALLMTHTHALANLREELLIELSHLSLAILAVAAGVTRWLELRLPPGDRTIPSRIWPICLTLLGAVLLLYREA